MRRVSRRKRPLDYLLPFLILISVGVIIVMGFQLFLNFGKQGKADVFFYIPEGKAKVLPYGNTDWDNAFSGTKLLLGDSLKTSFGSKAVLYFFNNTIIRLGADTAISLSDVEKTVDKEIIVMNLDNGQLWVNGNKSAGVREAVYEVRTKNLKIFATGTVFAVDSDLEQVVRVFDGDIKVDVLINVDGNERVVDTFSVGVGQQLYLDSAGIRSFQDNNNPSLLTAIDDSFKTTSWYIWNFKEDKSPTDFSVVNKISDNNLSLDNGLSDLDDSSNNDSSDNDSSDEDLLDDDDGFEKDLSNNLVSTPEIIEPVKTTTSVGTFVIKGTVSSNVSKIVVESEVNGKNDSYVLSQFKEGDSVWSYNVSEKFGNVAVGENTYKVFAYDNQGNKSSPARIVITFEKEKNQDLGDLESPKVLSFNGNESSKINSDTVTILGSVSGADKVVVNGYTLSKFVSGENTWSYVASESLGNLKVGENSFSVYALDADGNKSETLNFTVTYEKDGSASSGENAGEDDNNGSSGSGSSENSSGSGSGSSENSSGAGESSDLGASSGGALSAGSDSDNNSGGTSSNDDESVSYGF